MKESGLLGGLSFFE